jgi:diadenylate cyclase
VHLLSIIADLRFQDALDILFLTLVAYYLYRWFWGTKAFQALVGLLALGLVFTLARTWGLFLTTWVFQILWQVLVLLLIILFQSEIRQALERVNPLQALGLRKRANHGKWIQPFSEAAFSMAEKRIGALLIIQRVDKTEEWITLGEQVEGKPSPELLLSIFQKGSPLHDGAVLIKDGHIAYVACYLPLSTDEALPREWGTRHRAAMGLSERCDALVVAVSEERGEVTFFQDKQVAKVKTPDELSRLLAENLAPLRPAKKTWQERVRSLFLFQWKAKGGALLLVMIFWLLFAGQQNFEITLTLPVELKNIPERMEVVQPKNLKARIRVSGLRKDVSTLSDKNVQVDLDLSAAVGGKKTFQITRDEVHLPSERIQILNIDPAQVTFKFRQTPGT